MATKTWPCPSCKREFITNDAATSDTCPWCSSQVTQTKTGLVGQGGGAPGKAASLAKGSLVTVSIVEVGVDVAINGKTQSYFKVRSSGGEELTFRVSKQAALTIEDARTGNKPVGTYDIYASMLALAQGQGLQLAQVRIADYSTQAKSYVAELVFAANGNGGKTIVIPSRPSDSAICAMRGKLDLLVNPKLFARKTALVP